MKILHFALTDVFNEEMSYQENLMTKYHAKDGHDVILLTNCYELNSDGNIRYTPPNDKVLSNGVRLIRMDYRKIFNHFITSKIRKFDGIYRLLEQLSPDIIFFHNPQTIELLTLVKYARSNPDLHIYVDNHADYINSANNWLSKYLLHKILWKYCVKRIEPFVTKFYGVTPLRCEFLRDMYNLSGDKIELLEMGADDESINFNQRSQIKHKIRTTLGISENDFVLITGGKIDKEKNIHSLVRAVDELANDNIKLIIFGTPNQRMRTIFDNLSNPANIINIGWIDAGKIYDYFMASDLAVFPGTHSVLWEQSIGTGMPGVFKYWKGMDHIDLGGNCKFLFNDQVDEIKNVLKEIVDNPAEYRKMKKVAEEIGIKKFSYSEISRRAIQF